jgi:2-phospho-L-lactate/phosphoenolpyruvate guanylyltransferase
VTWTAIVPIKPAATRKTRLATLDPAMRVALTERMLAHVLRVTGDHAAIARVLVLSRDPVGRSGWLEDQGRGLNRELQAVRGRFGNVLVVHADLPFLHGDDLAALIDAAHRCRAAIARDKTGSGTNAVALTAGCDIAFAFGADSLRRHHRQYPAGAIVDRPGLAQDIDTPDDLHACAMASIVGAPASCSKMRSEPAL